MRAWQVLGCSKGLATNELWGSMQGGVGTFVNIDGGPEIPSAF